MRKYKKRTRLLSCNHLIGVTINENKVNTLTVMWIHYSHFISYWILQFPPQCGQGGPWKKKCFLKSRVQDWIILNWGSTSHHEKKKQKLVHYIKTAWTDLATFPRQMISVSLKFFPLSNVAIPPFIPNLLLLPLC